MTFLILRRLMAPLPSRLATPGSIIELVHSGDREALRAPAHRLRWYSLYPCECALETAFVRAS